MNHPVGERQCCCRLLRIEWAKLQELADGTWALPDAVFQDIGKLVNPRAHAHPVGGFPEQRADLRLVLIKEGVLMPGDDLRLLDWIEIFALQILLGTNRQHTLTADLTHDHREHTWFTALSANESPRRAAAMSIHQLHKLASSFDQVVVRPHDFRDPKDSLKILIVTSKLLTGFDAPILQAMYLDKLLKEHTLLQAICRTNRPYPSKTHGLIVDYLGIFDDVAKALGFDGGAVQQVISNLDELKDRLPIAVAACLTHFPGVDRTVGGYEGLLAAQEHLPNNTTRDAFAKDFSVLSQIWEALSPDPVLQPHADDYRWLSQVYESVKPPSGNGRLLWHSLGAKTIELIHEHVHVETVRGDLETLVMDADVLADLLSNPDPKKAKEIEIKIIARLHRHKDNPRFIELGERLEELRDRQERGVENSINFLKQLLAIARDVVEAEKQIDPEEEQDRAIAALTELFNEVRSQNTPVVVERIVADIDAIVKVVRFPGWQQTIAGEREVRQALRKTLLKYKLHQDQDLFDRAYGYIAQYY